MEKEPKGSSLVGMRLKRSLSCHQVWQVRNTCEHLLAKKTYVSCQCAFLFFLKRLGWQRSRAEPFGLRLLGIFAPKESFDAQSVYSSSLISLSLMPILDFFRSQVSHPRETTRMRPSNISGLKRGECSIVKNLSKKELKHSVESHLQAHLQDHLLPVIQAFLGWNLNNLSSLIECPCQTTSICQASRSCEVLRGKCLQLLCKLHRSMHSFLT